jgi:hypothetical protein
MSMANRRAGKCRKVFDLIAERAFLVNGKRMAIPAVAFRLWRPFQPKADYPGVDMS